jgi:hypothetical protein
VGNAVKQRGRISVATVRSGRRVIVTDFGTAHVIKRASFPERVVNGVYHFIDAMSASHRHAESPGTMHIGTTIETEPVRDILGIRAKS